MPKQKQGKVIMDIDAIMDFIFAPDEKRTTDVELEETFSPETGENKIPSSLALSKRVKRESKSGEHDQHEAIRVNLITRLLDEVDELEVDASGINCETTFGEDVAYNTLFHYGFLKQV